MSGVNPQGCQVFSYKHPSAAELEHDFLWRTTRDLPGRGKIGIFNRSYYEEVLIVRVHPEILYSEALPEAPHDEKLVCHDRYRSITNLERRLHENGTRIIKFFLHLSKEEQRKRFLARIDEKDKNWKFSTADIAERGFWNQYMKAYEKCLSATSTREAPWYDTATSKGCDPIVMASHGRHGVSALVLGSETVKVLTHCKIPVLIHR